VRHTFLHFQGNFHNTYNSTWHFISSVFLHRSWCKMRSILHFNINNCFFCIIWDLWKLFIVQKFYNLFQVDKPSNCVLCVMFVFCRVRNLTLKFLCAPQNSIASWPYRLTKATARKSKNIVIYIPNPHYKDHVLKTIIYLDTYYRTLTTNTAHLIQAVWKRRGRVPEEIYREEL